MTADRAADDWDVFISYAREDYVQAKDLHDALLECVTARGGTPRVFLDVSRTGIPGGADWQSYLEEALRGTRHVVALYSQTYFEKDVCQWELHRAYELRLTEGGRFVPLLIDPGAVKKVPYVVNRINWIPTTRPHWIEEVRKALGLSTAVARPALRFDAPVGDAVAGHTLAPLTVTAATPEGAPAWPEGSTVTLAAQPPGAGLTGTLSVRVSGGAAVFGDLAFGSAAPEVVLVASAPGCEPVTTAPFPVRAPQERSSSWDAVDRPVIDTRGLPVFLPDGRTLAVLDGLRLTVHQPNGSAYEAVGTAKLGQRPRLWAHGRHGLAVADWSGQVVVASPRHGIRVVGLPAPADARLNVPGALAFGADDVLYIGMWSGSVWRLPPGSTEPERVLDHPAGVQVLAADGTDLLVGGLDGTLTRYVGRRIATEHVLEPVLLGIARVGDFVLVVGEQHVHRLNLTTRQILRVTLPVAPVTDVLACGELIAIVDARGQGVCFDGELAVRVGFHTVPGARPVGSALGGRLLVLEHPDGSHALMREGRTTHVCGHPLDVSPDGSLAAVSDGERLLVLPVSELGEEGTRA
ncbi:TIR domain-containing protein [Streptomyces geranii]|uniref:TIR domain-containing protein n=1 Tax=Streptomyces geranii TaxID=2058923 RepID=UPI000D024E82|nr:TIR domain-containing protein [Streptomyces geranii]